MHQPYFPTGMDVVGHYGTWLSVTENDQLVEMLCEVSMLNTFVADAALSWTTRIAAPLITLISPSITSIKLLIILIFSQWIGQSLRPRLESKCWSSQ